MYKMSEMVPKLKDRTKKHRTDNIDLSNFKLPNMAPAAPKKPKQIKVKKR